MRTLPLFLLGLAAGPLAAQRPIRVVTSLPTYAAITREIVGDRASVTAIAQGDEEPHFVQPKPSFVPLLGGADLFVTTGLDLELWVPALLDKAGNPRVSEGGPGYVAAYRGIRLLEVPVTVSRSQGDIHVYGNPHIHTDPVNAIQIARNILDGLLRVAPGDGPYFRERERAFEHRILAALYGEELVRLLTPETLLDLARAYQDWEFLERNSYQGAPLVGRLGGWMKTASVFRGKEMICYHKEWVYFSARFNLPCVEYIEPKPGIPPTPRHVQRVIELIRTRHIPVIFSPNYFDRNQIREIAARTGATPVIVAAQTGGAPGVERYEDLVSLWIAELARAYSAAPGAATRP
ncbi:MAG TPA: metal ABC transporter substrate-binding protein [Gemmatimonadales bacterium]|nr:metal ABC transporter substrate-binding protein [Gemmatimonadales bacterium]